MNQNVIVYTASICPVCGMVKSFLDSFDITYEEVIVDLKPITMAKLIRETKRFTLPQTNIDGEWISGFHPEKMLKILLK